MVLSPNMFEYNVQNEGYIDRGVFPLWTFFDFRFFFRLSVVWKSAFLLIVVLQNASRPVMQNPGESRGHAVPDLHELPKTKPPFLCLLLLHVLDVEKLGLRPRELCLERFGYFDFCLLTIYRVCNRIEAFLSDSPSSWHLSLMQLKKRRKVA